MGPSTISTPPSLRSLAVGLLISFVPCTLGQGQRQGQGQQSGLNYTLTTDEKCGCYRTNTTSPSYFANHHFADFRSLPQYVSTPNVITDAAASQSAPATNQFFAAANWTSMWRATNWNNLEMMRINNSDISGSDATYMMVNSPNNIYIEKNNDTNATSQTYMTMRTTRLHNFQTAAELETTSTGYRFVSVRMYARTLGAPGAITAMFTYRPGANNNLQLVQEADLEIRTRDPQTRIQFTNQPSWNANGDIPAATRNVTMPAGRRWSEWAHYRMDWTPGSTTWYINGQLASTITFQAPRDASQVLFNSWGDGGTWSGPMAYNETASLQIQWLEMIFNNTDPKYAPKPGACTSICSIDDTPEIGTPVLVTGNVGAGQGGNQGGNRGGSQGGQTGNQGGNRGGGQGGNQGGNRGGGQGGQGGGNRGGSQGGQGGNQGGNRGGQQGGQNGQGGQQGGNRGGQNGGQGQQGGQAGGGAGAANRCSVAKYGQCGGKNYKGSTGRCEVFACDNGTNCRAQNDYYSQCL